MRISYNPRDKSPLTGVTNTEDLIFDLSGKCLYVKGVKLEGTDTTYSIFQKQTSTDSGLSGLVPIPNYNSGSTNRYLREDGTWVTPPNTTYSTFTGASSSAAGTSGLVPAPAAGEQTYFLRGDATWVAALTSITKAMVEAVLTGTITSHTHNYVSTVVVGSTSYPVSGNTVTLPAYPTIPTSLKNPTALTLKINSGTVEGTNLYTYDGSTAKTLNIVPGTNVSFSTESGKLVITSTNTTYSAGTGLTLSGTTFYNSGVRSISTGSTNGTISVDTNGTSAEVSVKGLGSAAYTNSSAYATASHSHSDYLKSIASGNTNYFTITTSNLAATISPKIVSISNASSSNLGITTSYDIKTYVDASFAANDAMIFKGTIGTSGTITSLPTSGYSAGWTYRVITAGTYAGVVCEVGDLIICITDATSGQTAINNAHWTVALTNIDGAVVGPTSSTDGYFALFNGTSGKIIKQYSGSVGSSTQGIYFSGGVPKAMSYTLSKSVPSDAVFTDTHYASSTIVGASSTATANAAASNGAVYLNHIEAGSIKSAHLIKGTGATTVTSDANGVITISSTNTNTTYTAGNYLTLSSTTFNHNTSGVTANTYGPTANATLSHSGTFIVPNYKVDSYGHITAGGYITYTLPADNNTTYSVATNTYLGLIKPWYNHTAASTGPTAGSNATAVAVNGISTTAGRYYALEMDSNGRGFVNVPWSNTTYTFTANNPTLDWSTKSTIGTIGGTTFYITMPANPNTDTHWSSYLIVNNATTSTANTSAALTNGNVYLNLVENGAVRNSHKIIGSGATTVTSDASGNLTISSTNTVYTHPTQSAISVTNANGLVLSGITVNTLGHVTGVTSKTLTASDIPSLSYLPLSGGTMTGGISSMNIIPKTTNTYTLGSSSYVWSNVYATTFTGALSGNATTATTATTLATARTIWGQSFNGSANVDGLLKITANTGNYCEGIRIKPYNSWTTILLGGTDLSADTGTSTKSWSIHNNDGNFYINKNASSTAQSPRLWGHSNGWTVGNTTASSYALNAASFYCASWVRTYGSAGWYSETYGGGIYMTDSTWVRTFNSKSFYCSAVILAGGRIWTGYDSGETNSISCSNWFRSNGATGWYNASYGDYVYSTGTYIQISGHTVYTPNKLLSASSACSWLAGLLGSGAYNVADATDTGSYWPWLRGANTSSGKYFSLGVLGSSLYIIGSTTSRTSNGYDYGWYFNMADGWAYGNFQYASEAKTLARGGNLSYPMTFNWSGQSGQPTWLWGSNDGTNIYVWNPSNFSVNYASSAGSASYATYSGYTSQSLTLQVNGTSYWTFDGSTARTLNIKAGSNVTISGDSSGNVTINSSYTNTTYSFSNNASTLSWGTTSTIGTVGGVALTVTMPSNPNTNTLNTAGASNTTSTIYLVGATSQTDGIKTYSNASCYASGGYLYSGGSKVLTAHQTIYTLTCSAGSFSAGSYTPNSAAKTIYIPTKTSHLTNDSGFITGSYLPLGGGTMFGTINSRDIIPSSGSSYDLGSSSYYWNKSYSYWNWTGFTYLSGFNKYATGGRSVDGIVTINNTGCTYRIIELSVLSSKTFLTIDISYTILLIILRISKSAFARTTKYLSTLALPISIYYPAVNIVDSEDSGNSNNRSASIGLTSNGYVWTYGTFCNNANMISGYFLTSFIVMGTFTS